MKKRIFSFLSRCARDYFLGWFVEHGCSLEEAQSLLVQRFSDEG